MEHGEGHLSCSSQDLDTIMTAMTIERQKLVQGRPGARENMISQARSLVAALETPMEHILEVIWANVSLVPLSRLTLRT